MHAPKALALPRANHSGELTLSDFSSPAFHACGSASAFVHAAVTAIEISRMISPKLNTRWLVSMTLLPLLLAGFQARSRPASPRIIQCVLHLSSSRLKYCRSPRRMFHRILHSVEHRRKQHRLDVNACSMSTTDARIAVVCPVRLS